MKKRKKEKASTTTTTLAKLEHLKTMQEKKQYTSDALFSTHFIR